MDIPKSNQVCALALPGDDGKWRACKATFDVVDGILHKIVMPGFEVRSAGGSVGISVVIHFVDVIGGQQTEYDVLKITYVDGVMRTREPTGWISALDVARALGFIPNA